MTSGCLTIKLKKSFLVVRNIRSKTEKRSYLTGFFINYKHIAWSDKRCEAKLFFSGGNNSRFQLMISLPKRSPTQAVISAFRMQYVAF